jgi:hypothetical protein
MQTGAARRGPLAVLAIVALLVVAAPARAQRPRLRFEPTDLRLQPVGVAEVDVQGGFVTGADGQRVVMPDVEASVGISSHVELALDGTFGLDHLSKPRFLDNTLLAVRIGMFDEPDAPGSSSSWSGGVQAGPRLPTLPQAHGLGMEALAIVGRTAHGMHLFAQVGSIIDPSEPVEGYGSRIHPYALEAGLDLDLDLDDDDTWSLNAELGSITYFSPHRDQLHLAGGPAVRVSKWLELSLVGLVGVLPGGDRFGLLAGANTHFKAF